MWIDFLVNCIWSGTYATDSVWNVSCPCISREAVSHSTGIVRLILKPQKEVSVSLRAVAALKREESATPTALDRRLGESHNRPAVFRKERNFLPMSAKQPEFLEGTDCSLVIHYTYRAGMRCTNLKLQHIQGVPGGMDKTSGECSLC
jgi:hypothetical protein